MREHDGVLQSDLLNIHKQSKNVFCFVHRSNYYTWKCLITLWGSSETVLGPWNIVGLVYCDPERKQMKILKSDWFYAKWF